MNDDRYRIELQNRIALGLDTEAFLNTTLGKYLEGRAQAEAVDAMQGLKTADPADAKAIQALQNAVFRAESFANWLNDAIADGSLAQNELKDEA